MKLPEHVVAEGLDLAKSATYYGIPLGDLSRDELLAVAALAFKSYHEAMRRRSEESSLLSTLRNAANPN